MTYYYLNSANTPVGPLSLSDIRKLAASGVIPKDTLVCETGKEDWLSLAKVSSKAASATPCSPPLTAPPLGVETSGYPAWLPIASIVAGVLAILTACIPILSFLFAAASLTAGLLALMKLKLQESQRTYALVGVGTGGIAILISLSVFFLGLIGFVGNSEAAAIERVLKDDAQIVRAAKSKFRGNAISQTRYVASQMQGIDTSRCPADFRYAFQRHVNAWEQSVPYVSANTGLTAFFEGLYAGYTEDYRVLGVANYQAQVALQQVNATFADVKSISAKYGAKIPRI